MFEKLNTKVVCKIPHSFLTRNYPPTAKPDNGHKHKLIPLNCVSDMQSECEGNSESAPVVRIRSLSVGEPRDAIENHVDTKNKFSDSKDSTLVVPQQRSGPGRFCRKCGHVISTSQ
jgi:hypothetical protein